MRPGLATGLIALALSVPGLSQAATCTIWPQNATRTPGQSVPWSYSASGISSPSRLWTFEGGNPPSSTSSSRTVTYANSGTFATRLRLTRGSTVVDCSTAVTVATPDTQAPTVPGGLAAKTVGSTQIDLSWSASTDNVGVTGYRLERCAGATCTGFTQIAAPSGTSHSDTGLAVGTYRYRVRAADAKGNLSGYSTIASATLQAADTTAPKVSIGSAAVNPLIPPQTVTLAADASDDRGVTRVEFYDGATLIATDTAAPYSYAWSVTAAAGGSHIWTARAYDAASNKTTSNQLRLIVMKPVPNVSINSTSENSQGQVATAVPEQPILANSASTAYTVLAINDLGMHCGDFDTRVASILPPFQVLLGQVVQKGGTGTTHLNPAGVDLYYSAASNANDPILASGTPLEFKGDLSTYKTNFWDTVAKGAYDPFYPATNPFTGAALTPLAGPPFNVTVDTGLPVPNVEDLYIGPDRIVDRAGVSSDGFLSAVLHAMPGTTNPYAVNVPQLAQEHYENKPFFVNFPFGYVADKVNWYEGAGVPFAAFDDVGRANPYPMVRVQAKSGGNVVATVDTVLPISGEASCANCHADPADVQGSRSSTPTDRLRTAKLPVATSLDDPDPDMPNLVSVEYASDINVLRLHDLKHGASYVKTSCNAAGSSCLADPAKKDPCTIGGTAGPNGSASCLTNKALVQNKPVVCQVCHYTPALDLAQFGPVAGPPGSLANGRNQVAHKSNSNVMHSHHGSLAGNLFPTIPAPQQDPSTGAIVNQNARVTALENSCYQCHPGKNTKCLRGAMFNGGMLCSDCHGSMAQVGNDFSKNVSPSNPGAFLLAKDFYTNPNTPRVPWANEPGCGSCHTGDAASNMASAPGVLKNLKDIAGNTDEIRLRQAFVTGDAKATPIVPTNKRFAEPVVSATFVGDPTKPETAFPNPGAGNPKLYRVSTGHGGVMCEGCHGATHAEWPNGNPSANDNVTAKQLQGHTGAIVECGTCHTTTALPSNTQGGPHGMHLVNDSRWWSQSHKDAAKAENRKPNGGSCGACHGIDHKGTVLSRTPVDRTWRVESSNRPVAAGEPVGCDVCHSLSKSFGN